MRLGIRALGGVFHLLDSQIPTSYNAAIGAAEEELLDSGGFASGPYS